MRNFSQWHAKFVSDHGGKEPSVADAWNGAVCNCLDHPASSVVEDAASLRTLIAQCGVMLYSASDDAMSRLAQALNHHPTVVQQPDAGEPGRCEYCDGTGDVHGIDGEWRGECTECKTPDAPVSDADINGLTLEKLGKWPSFEAQSWACKVVHCVIDNWRDGPAFVQESDEDTDCMFTPGHSDFEKRQTFDPLPAPQVDDPYNYKGMFEDAVRALAEIDKLLGLPEDGCNDPQVTVSALADFIAGHKEMQKFRDEWVDAQYATAPNSSFDVEAAAQSIASMVTEWVKDGPRGADWTAGLPGIIARRLKRFIAPQVAQTADDVAVPVLAAAMALLVAGGFVTQSKADEAIQIALNTPGAMELAANDAAPPPSPIADSGDVQIPAELGERIVARLSKAQIFNLADELRAALAAQPKADSGVAE